MCCDYVSVCVIVWVRAKKIRKFHAFLLDFALEPAVGVGGGCFVFSAIDDFDVDAVLDFLYKKMKIHRKHFFVNWIACETWVY